MLVGVPTKTTATTGRNTNEVSPYSDLDTCNKASEAIKTAGHEAICIPKGEDFRFTEQSSQMDMMFDKFLNMIKELQKLETKQEG